MESRETVEDDGDATAVVLGRRLHLREHVLEEEQRPVGLARQARSEPAGVALLLPFSEDLVVVVLPLHRRTADWQA
jgi:hypothetical protein